MLRPQTLPIRGGAYALNSNCLNNFAVPAFWSRLSNTKLKTSLIYKENQ